MRSSMLPGDYLVTLPCPRCEWRAEVWVTLTVEMKAVRGAGELRCKMKSKPAEHLCRDEVKRKLADLDETDDVGTRPLDFRERQAGDR